MIINDDELLNAKNIDDLKEVIVNSDNDADKINHVVKIIDDVDKEISRDTKLIYSALIPIIDYLMDSNKTSRRTIEDLIKYSRKKYVKNISNMDIYDAFKNITGYIVDNTYCR